MLSLSETTGFEIVGIDRCIFKNINDTYNIIATFFVIVKKFFLNDIAPNLSNVIN